MAPNNKDIHYYITMYASDVLDWLTVNTESTMLNVLAVYKVKLQSYL